MGAVNPMRLQGAATRECQLLRWDPGRPHVDSFTTGFEAFRSRDEIIDGLARVTGNHLEILAIVSGERGGLTRFIAAAKMEFDRVTVWGIYNPLLRDALLRHDFTPYAARDAWTGDQLQGLSWSREEQLRRAAAERVPLQPWMVSSKPADAPAGQRTGRRT